MNSTHPHIDPHMAPNGLVFRITRADGTVIWFETLPDFDDIPTDTCADIAARHHHITNTNTQPGRPAQLEVFDGDTGQQTATFTILHIADDA